MNPIRRKPDPRNESRRAGAGAFRAPLACASLALFLVAGCAAEKKSVAHEVRTLVDHGHYSEAVEKAAKAAADAPGDQALQDLHREASLAYLLEQARRLTFDDHDEEALVVMRQALELDPQSKEVRDWLDKTNRKLALRHLHLALEEHAKDMIPEALGNYEKALVYMPADKDALIGRELCQHILQHREELGGTYFDQGVRALSDFWLEQARSRFAYSHKYRPGEERTQGRKTQVEQLLADQRMSTGEAFEKSKNFGAARNEYRIAALLDPSNEEARASVARVQTELDVGALLDRAGMNVVRGLFEEASKLVEEAGAKTVEQKDEVDGALATIREARFAKEYDDALVLEHDYRYEEAVQKYDDLLEKAQFYKDVIARRDTLNEYIRLAADLYAKAAAEKAPDKKLEYLNQIAVFWPEYKDVHAQIAELEKPAQSG
jgi:tetratricopeptide (TPR) repeat protein